MYLVCRSGRSLNGRRLVWVCGCVGLGQRVVRCGRLGSKSAVQVGAGQEGLVRGALEAVLPVRAGGLRAGVGARQEGESQKGAVGLPVADRGLRDGRDGVLGSVQGSCGESEDAS